MKKISKLKPLLLIVMLFVTILLPNIVKNKTGKWSFATAKADDGDEGSGGSGYGGLPYCGSFHRDGSYGYETYTSLETHIIASTYVTFNASAQGSMGGKLIQAATAYANRTVPVNSGYYKECSSFDIWNSCNLANEGYMIPCPTDH